MRNFSYITVGKILKELKRNMHSINNLNMEIQCLDLY